MSATEADVCPSCGSAGIQIFYQLDQLPVGGGVLTSICSEAAPLSLGKLRLGFCLDCGFITNLAYQTGLLSQDVLAGLLQDFPPSDGPYLRRFAAHLVEAYSLRGKRVLSLQPGLEPFLNRMAEACEQSPKATNSSAYSRRVFDLQMLDGFSSLNGHAPLNAELIVAGMLPAFSETSANWLSNLRKAIERLNTCVLFFVPDTARSLQNLAFWDFSYPQVSYFSTSSLVRLLQGSGFELLSLRRDCVGRYLILEAVPVANTVRVDREASDSLLSKSVRFFIENVQAYQQAWKSKIQELRSQDMKIALWGMPSQLASFLVSLDLEREIALLVSPRAPDDPSRLAGTQLPVFSPAALAKNRPQVVIGLDQSAVRGIESYLIEHRLCAEVIRPDELCPQPAPVS